MSSFFSLLNGRGGGGPSAKSQASFPDSRTDAEWQAVLSPQQFKILRKEGTEPAFTGEYDKHKPDAKGPGVYHCAGCNAELYKAGHKFNSGCGWPAFFDAIPGAVGRGDHNDGSGRIEIWCNNCGGHLGHVFHGEGFKTPTDDRHCVNSISLKFHDGKESSL